MNGRLSVRTEKNGFTFIEFTVNKKEDVDELTIHMIETGLDLLYEPRKRAQGYESCVICGERSGLRIISYQ